MHSNIKRLSIKKSPLALAIASAIAGGLAQPALALGDGAMCIPTIESTFTVTSNLGDTSEGTLRAAIVLANANADCSQIEFANNIADITLDAPTTIEEDLNIVGHGKDTLNISTLSGNAIHATRGDLHVSNLKVSDSPNAGIYQQYADLTVDNVLLDNNGYGIHADDAYDTVVRNSTISNSEYDSGIKFYNNSTDSTLLIDKSDISTNHASGDGGGLFAYVVSGAHIKITNSTFAGNTTFSSGGAIAIQNTGTTNIDIENTTISGNSSDRYGGGIYHDDSTAFAALNIKSTTIINNSAHFTGGGIRHMGSNASINIENSVIALNTSRSSNSGRVNLDGVFNSADFSWLGDNNAYDDEGGLLADTPADITNAPTGSVIGGDESTLNLGDLADNGGPTKTHLPAAGSPLLEAGNPTTANLPATDQRGSTREVGTLDIGAVEVTEAQSSSSSGIGSLSYGWLVMLAGVFIRRKSAK